MRGCNAYIRLTGPALLHLVCLRFSFLHSNLLFFEDSIFFEGDVGVKFGGAFVAIRDEVETDTTNVLLGKDIRKLIIN